MNIWYSYDPEDGYDTHATSDQAQEAAEGSLEHYRDKSTDGWHKDTDSIAWGLLVPYGEVRQCNRRDAPDDSDFNYICDYDLCSGAGGDPLEEAYRRLERQTDWYDQRYKALSKWVKEEVDPLSREVARRFFAICANGSPAPHEQAAWTDTKHGLQLRAERSDRERDAALAEVERLSESARAAWEAECIMRGQRDQYAVALKQERHEVARLQAEAAPMNEHFTAGYRDGSHDAFRRGAEAMREACVKACLNAPPDTHRTACATAMLDLSIPEDR